eukprot:14460595-Alexandrium_andersonii.AAC.1
MCIRDSPSYSARAPGSTIQRMLGWCLAVHAVSHAQDRVTPAGQLPANARAVAARLGLLFAVGRWAPRALPSPSSSAALLLRA